MSIKIKANLELFEEIRKILRQASTTLTSIVQNDIEVELDQLIEFWDDYEKTINRMDDWMLKVKNHIRRCRLEEVRKWQAHSTEENPHLV